MKRVLSIIGAIALSSAIFAGGFLTNTNQSVRFLRNPARGASTEIDAVYSNPAGLSFMNHEGLWLSLNDQAAFQTRVATTTFAPFAMNGGSDTKEYKGEASAWVIPSLQVAYKLKNFVFSGFGSVIGGGGTLKFNNGLPSFEQPVSTLPVMANSMLSQMGMPADYNVSKYSLEQSLQGTSITYGAQLGISYKISDLFSAYVGGRASIVNNGYEGYLRNIQINPNIPPMGLSGDNMIPASTFIEGLKDAHFIDEATAAGLMAQVSDKEIDVKQSGWGIAPVLGFDFKYNHFNLGIKYDFMTSITIKNKTTKDNTGMYPDGKEINNDIPALLSVGASYKFFREKLTLNFGSHIFFDKDAKMANNIQKDLSNNTYEWLAGLEYKISNRFLVSAGGQITRFGLTDKFISDMNNYCNSASVGVGGEIGITDKLLVNVGYLFTKYDDYTKTNPYGDGSKEKYHRTSMTFGIGLDYKF
ncbi:MAG: aromatic hydrocarbon degradation protein [Paludibacter sp.]|nr:aromatic hydrocarbon degradation protein [Paludibacter sp.]